MEKSWEKTVEWHFASEALSHLDIVSPLDGTKEISDLVANVGSLKWILVEFKHNEDSLNDENAKYPEKRPAAMYSVMKDYFCFEKNFPPNIKTSANNVLFNNFVNGIESNKNLSSYLNVASLNATNVLNKLNNGVGKGEVTKVQNNLKALASFQKNPVGEIKSNALALFEKYERRSLDTTSMTGPYAGSASLTFDVLPEIEPHLIVFGKIEKKGRQRLRLMRYWSYTIPKGGLREAEISNLARRWGLLKQIAGTSYDDFIKYVNALSFARGYLPNLSGPDNDKFGYFSAIGIYKKRGIVVTGRLDEIMGLVETIYIDLNREKLKKDNFKKIRKEKIFSLIKGLQGKILDRLKRLLSSDERLPA